ncbi:Smr/MutS family protein [Salinispira pacifica]|uniref:Smr domain protein n=1 Tax=Salinispira pacifica TaxID=1307761 RepID=V5WKL1_9SPIO|nr:Smr/MutS family protein [Salinispira pacifica]AHC16180.1 Smr domain protein [Salinispira pacifica]
MTDFGKILEEWDGIRSRGRSEGRSSSDFERMVDGYLDMEESRSKDDEREQAEHGGVNPRSLKIESTLDLHGMRAQAAEISLRHFIDESYRRGWKKVLIIHGKGNHSTDGPVLKDTVMQVVRAHPHAGRHGVPGRSLGGSGALWLVIK